MAATDAGAGVGGIARPGSGKPGALVGGGATVDELGVSSIPGTDRRC